MIASLTKHRGQPKNQEELMREQEQKDDRQRFYYGPRNTVGQQ